MMSDTSTGMRFRVLALSFISVCHASINFDESDADKPTYTKYSLEARLHFRLHSLTAQLKTMREERRRVSKSMNSTPAGSWHSGLNKYDDEDNNPLDIEFNSSLDSLGDPITLEL
ncbi:hypothetical protein ACTXT7_009966 [Hymenolepis weldensis]